MSDEQVGRLMRALADLENKLLARIEALEKRDIEHAKAITTAKRQTFAITAPTVAATVEIVRMILERM